MPETKPSSEVLSAYHQLFLNNPLGEVVINDLKAAHYYNASTFDIDSNLTNLREGERNVVLRILTILAQDPADYEPIDEGR